MAIPVQGCTVTWGGESLQEVQTLEYDGARGLPRGRVAAWTPDNGTLRLLLFSPSNLAASEYGKRKRFQLIGRASAAPDAAPITILDNDTILTDIRVESNANDAFRFVATFAVQDTVGAPSNP